MIKILKTGRGRVLIAALCAVLVIVAIIAVQAGRRTAWTDDCTKRGGHIERLEIDTKPILVPGSRVVYSCYGRDGELISQWR